MPGKDVFPLSTLSNHTKHSPLSHSDSDAGFQPIVKAHLFYVYLTQQFILAALPRFPQGCCYMPYRHEKEKRWEQCRVWISFSCVKYHLLVYTRIISLYFTIRGVSAVTSWTARLNCTDARPSALWPSCTQWQKSIATYLLKRNNEQLEKGVGLSTNGWRCQGSWPVAIAIHVFT